MERVGAFLGKLRGFLRSLPQAGRNFRYWRREERERALDDRDERRRWFRLARRRFP